jgi:hypothetical protein
MVTLNNEPTRNSWSELDLQQSNIDEETETCVGVRDVLSYMLILLKSYPRKRASSNFH